MIQRVKEWIRNRVLIVMEPEVKRRVDEQLAKEVPAIFSHIPHPLATSASRGIINNPSIISQTIWEALLQEKLVNPGVMVDQIKNLANCYYVQGFCVNPAYRTEEEKVLRVVAEFLFSSDEDVTLAGLQVAAMLKQKMTTIQ